MRPGARCSRAQVQMGARTRCGRQESVFGWRGGANYRSNYGPTMGSPTTAEGGVTLLFLSTSPLSPLSQHLTLTPSEAKPKLKLCSTHFLANMKWHAGSTLTSRMDVESQTTSRYRFAHHKQPIVGRHRQALLWREASCQRLCFHCLHVAIAPGGIARPANAARRAKVRQLDSCAAGAQRRRTAETHRTPHWTAAGTRRRSGRGRRR